MCHSSVEELRRAASDELREADIHDVLDETEERGRQQALDDLPTKCRG